MEVKIHTIPLGFDHAYLLQGEGCILIDGGTPGKADVFRRAIERLGVEPRQIRLLLMSHGHWDHIASASDLQALTGAPIAMHHGDKRLLEDPPQPMPSGPPGVTTWGRFVIGVAGLYTRFVRIPPAQVDIVLDGEDLSLSEYGLPGKVMHTPGHSPGSVSVLLESGEAFVGDLAMAMPPLRFSAGLPVFAEDMSAVKQSWRRLLEAGARTIYPAHGKPFPAEIMRRAVA